jgi:uncharacterized protein (TIGR02646 family)
MKRIRKSDEPGALADFRNRFASQSNSPGWREFRKNTERRSAVLRQLEADQRGLCAYCEIRLTDATGHGVEHFIPQAASTPDRDLSLDWNNLLITCRGGIDPEAAQGETSSDDAPRSVIQRSCGDAKSYFSAEDQFLNPLDIPPFPNLFRINTLDGTLSADQSGCTTAKIPIEIVEQTIEKLGLNVQRLKNNRHVVMESLSRALEEWETDGQVNDPFDDEESIAEDFFGDGSSHWPPFFTTIRSYLGDGAERHLEKIGYVG